ncbi:MAG: OmpA family protein [Gemmatimonadetes bacterium]|jgi:outer membrane protein OmpA-like peptidoglycan-associated protein|nr:OmpA family protein [Gemmatimonadota bacterium]
MRALPIVVLLCLSLGVARGQSGEASVAEGAETTAADEDSVAIEVMPGSKYGIQFIRYPASDSVTQMIVNQAVYVANFGDRDGVKPGSIFQVYGGGDIVGLVRVEQTFRDSAFLRMVTLERKVDLKSDVVIKRGYRLYPKYVLLETVNFGSGKPDFTPEMHERMRFAARFILSFPDYPVVLEGHTDNTGEKAKNVQLAIRRASSIEDYLNDIQLVPRSQMFPVGYADERPLASNSKETGRFANRRVDIVLVDELPPEAVPGSRQAPTVDLGATP